MTHDTQVRPIQPREKLDFQLGGGIPRFWNGGDPFKTRFFDAMSLTFPIGERYFISTVRAYRDQIQDPHLLQEVKDFTRQEAQHSMLHTRYNDRLKKHGIGVDAILEGQERRLFGIIRQHCSREFTLGITAASEHITAIMADCFVERPHIFNGADERMRALYVWHAMEEMEHKGVAYDVLVDIAKASYWTRVSSMMLVTLLFPYHVFRIMKHMLQADGFTRWERTKIWAKGLWWLYKPGGIFLPMLGKYFSYLKPGFHPWQEPVVPSYEPWVRLLKETGDPVEAGNRLHAGLTQGLAHA